MAVSLYRRFRPSTWDKVIGQDHIVRTLINQIATDRVGHAYLFTGTRGTGKTSSAKIFARAVNCLHPQNGSPCGTCEVCLALSNPANTDILEIDAASNNGVDEIRELRENIQYPPSVGKYKVYIVDEVHMLTAAAFNALLKTLEEPPAHAIFILATTEAHKLPQTILSRCMRFDFRLVADKELIALLGRVFDEIGYPYEEKALELLAAHGEGSVRDTLSLADMCLSFCPDRLTADAVLEVLGASDFETLYRLAEAVLTDNPGELLRIVDAVADRGKGISTLGKELAAFFRDLIAIKNVRDYRAGFAERDFPTAKALADASDNYRIARAMDLLAGVENTLRYSTQPRIILEAVLVRAAEMRTDPSLDGLTSRIALLESKLNSLEQNGIRVAAPAPKAQPADAPKAEPPKIEDLVGKYAVSTESAPVFADDEDAPPEADARVREYWGAILTRLREEQYNMLYYSLQNQDDIRLNDTALTLYTKETATLDLLANDTYLTAINRILREIAGPQYTFSVVNAGKKKTLTDQARQSLNDLFGDLLTRNPNKH